MFVLALADLPKSMCRHGFLSSMDPQNDFFLTPTSANVAACAGNLDPDISTEVALRHVYLAPPVHLKLHHPPAGSSRRTLSHSDSGIVILIVMTLSSA